MTPNTTIYSICPQKNSCPKEKGEDCVIYVPADRTGKCVFAVTLNEPDKKVNRKKLEKQLEKLWSQAIKLRDKKCRYCGSDQRLSAHHIRIHKHLSTRYDINNGLTLCWRCHSLQRLNPELFHDRIIDTIGQPQYNALRLLSNVKIKYSIEELLRIKEQLQWVINQYG